MYYLEEMGFWSVMWLCDHLITEFLLTAVHILPFLLFLLLLLFIALLCLFLFNLLGSIFFFFISIMFCASSIPGFRAKCHFVFLADPVRVIVFMRMGMLRGRWQTESAGSVE